MASPMTLFRIICSKMDAGRALAAFCFALGCSLATAQPPQVPELRKLKKTSPEQLVDQLADPSYLRREIASRQLLAAGEAAVAPLEAAMRQGDLELVERGSMILQDLAALETPSKDNSAWDALSRLEKNGPGAAASRAVTAKSMVRSDRRERAHSYLAAAGIQVGPQELTLDSRPEVLHAVRFPADWSPTGETLQWLPWIYDATAVVVEGTSASAEVLAAVGRMPNIRQVQIRDADVTAEAIGGLASLERIDTLEFLFVGIGDDSEDVAAIAELPLRQNLVLTGTDFDPQDVETLRGQLPGLAITFSYGGFLGVQCNSLEPVCTVSAVVPGSAADRAQMMPGDVIVKFGEHPVATFADLQRAVRQYTPRDELKVVVRRAGEEVALPIRLGRL